MGGYVVATDMGGTFVDAVIWDLETRASYIGKAPTTPADPPSGIIDSVAAAAERARLPLDRILAESALFVNGTTVTTNAMIERKGSRTGLLITAGFEDTLSIGNVIARTAGLDEAQLLDYRHAERPAPIVSRGLVRGVIERIDAHGREIVPLDENHAMTVLDELVEQGIEALAICFLWSFRAPEHERRLKTLVTRRHPHLFTVASSDLVPIMREYERANTTVINAFLGKVFGRYAGGLRSRLKSEQHRQEPLIMQSVGGLAPAHEIECEPIATLFSGPVGGVIAGRGLAKDLNEPNLITTDMGGTSFDVGLILDGEPVTAAETIIERQIVAIPTVEIVTVGAGGGSIAKVDELGILRVGPESMGAVPGPACYGRGGTTPTVTDADVVLGYIDPEHFLGGRMEISKDTAVQSIKQIGNRLSMNVIEAAAAIYKIVNARMADLIRRATVERGHDPRDFVMAAFGGCGPTHSTGYGPEIGMRRIVVPSSATVFSAFGIGRSDLKHTWVRSFAHALRDERGSLITGTLPGINSTVSELLEEARIRLKRDGISPENAMMSFSADIRYRNQVHELTVALGSAASFREPDLANVAARFQAGYERRYGKGSSSPRAGIEWVNLRLSAVAPTRTWPEAPLALGTRSSQADSLIGRKPIYNIVTQRLEPTPIFQQEKLRPGDEISGPALVVSYGTTLPLHPGQELKVDPFGNMLISV
jgi:N-methylhydantoinase A